MVARQSWTRENGNRLALVPFEKKASTTSDERPWSSAVPCMIHWWLPVNATRPTVLKDTIAAAIINRNGNQRPGGMHLSHLHQPMRNGGGIMKLHLTKRWENREDEKKYAIAMLAYPSPTTWTCSAMSFLTSEQMLSTAAEHPSSVARAWEASDPAGHGVWPQ